MILETAIGAMGMTMEEFGNMEPWLFMRKLAGFQNRYVEKEKENWRRIMFVAFAMEVNNPYIKKKAATFDEFMRRSERGNVKVIKTEKELDALIG